MTLSIDPISDEQSKVIVDYKGGKFTFRRLNEQQMLKLVKATQDSDLGSQAKVIFSLLERIENAEFRGEPMTREHIIRDDEFPGAIKFKLMTLAAEALREAEEKNE